MGKFDNKLTILGEFMKINYDLHMHTALSPCALDEMTPNNIVNMSLINELDVIAITDHIEYQAHPNDVTKDLNRPYQLAKPEADKYNMIFHKQKITLKTTQFMRIKKAPLKDAFINNSRD